MSATAGDTSREATRPPRQVPGVRSTGQAPEVGADPPGALDLRPALFARYRRLEDLRHDFPLVLVDDGATDGAVVSLSGLFDDLCDRLAASGDATRVRLEALRLEREIRGRVARGDTGLLSELWARAESALAHDGEAEVAAERARLRAACAIDGVVSGCGRELPGRLVAHLWHEIERRKVARLRTRIDRLRLRLEEILRAEASGSEAGLSADALRSAVGDSFASAFDFAALSRVLSETKPMARLSDARRARIRGLLATLGSQTFCPAPAGDGRTTAGPAYEFAFSSPRAALDSYRERLPRLVELSKAMHMAALEIDGRYREDLFDPVFAAYGPSSLTPAELAEFPDYFVSIDAAALDPAESARLLEALAADLPLKILVRTDDAIESWPILGASPAGIPATLLAGAAIGMGGVYVLQTTSAELYRARERVARGLAFRGPALFTIFSGAGESTRGLPPYLVAAAALESRAFPALTLDPSAGPEWADRFSLDGNPQAERDWPIHTVAYEDDALQRGEAELAFTAADFLTCDARLARHFAALPRERWSEGMEPVASNVAAGEPPGAERLAWVLLVDGRDTLQRALVDSALLREARRCRQRWRSLQEWGGIHNSHAERLLAAERRAREEQARAEVAPVEKVVVTAASEVAAPAPDAAPARSPGEPYIETLRCSTCNECTRINDRMFKYNENKQAYIADLDAGTYADLVRAAESCQVAIIHPGKPRNPDEPGLAELLERAAKFP